MQNINYNISRAFRRGFILKEFGEFYLVSYKVKAVDIPVRLYLDVSLTNTERSSTARGLLDRRSTDDSVW